MAIKTILFLHTHSDRVRFKYYAKVFSIALESDTRKSINRKAYSTIDLENLLKFKECIEQQIEKVDKDFEARKILLVTRNSELKKYRQILKNINKGIELIKE